MYPLASGNHGNPHGASRLLKFFELAPYDLLDFLPEGLFLINTRWQIVYFNRKAEEITGFSREEAIRKFCWDIFRSNLCQQDCPLRVSMRGREVLMEREVEVTTKGGEKILLLVNTARIIKGGDMVLGGMETFHHLTCPEAELAQAGVRSFANIVGPSPRMQEIIQSLPMIAASDSNVLIQGESGTGKELVARALHLQSSRGSGPFVAVNCSAIPETLLESELFGHERGAFTGAVASKPGRFELAKGGTLFLDEIGDLKPELQVKLLRVLEEKHFMRVGGTRRVPLEARLLAATNIDLKEAMRRGRFREDLYYRLFTVPIHLPPLREKRKDIPVLVKHFLAQLNRKFDKRVRGLDAKAMKVLCRHSWPGNVRELQHVLEYCFVFARGPIIMERHLPDLESALINGELEMSLGNKAVSPLQALEKKTILMALETTRGNKQEAARILKISRSKLWRKMRLYQITDMDFKK
jgi:PAS domain S-box-containing protein